MKQPIQRDAPPSRSSRKPAPLSGRIEAAIAVMQMGVSDYSEIAAAVGLTCDEVKRIDMAEDPRIKSLATQGVPAGKRFHLVRPLACPNCLHKITIAPCVACATRTSVVDRQSRLPGRS